MMITYEFLKFRKRIRHAPWEKYTYKERCTIIWCRNQETLSQDLISGTPMQTAASFSTA